MGTREGGTHQAGRAWRRRAVKVVVALSLLAAGIAVIAGGVGFPSPPAAADGPAPCSAGGPPYPYHGFCATYDGDNTWYGTYGPGFPTPQGWGFCANRPAGGGLYPSPGYGYTPGSPPAGADTANDGPLGFAFSQAQAFSWWDGEPGQFTADQAAAAGKILYDSEIWHDPVPSMDPGVLAAFNDMAGWFDQARGATGTPQLFVGLIGGGSSFTTSATDDIHLQFPGSGAPLVGQAVLLSIANGTFDSPTGPTFIGASTDSNGNVLVPIYATSSAPVTVTVASLAGVGQPGLGFWDPTYANAQVLAGFSPPTTLQARQPLTGSGQPQKAEGTLSVEKAGDDSSYYPVAGAVFELLSGGTVVTSITTNDDGDAGPTQELPVGSYELHEAQAPAGYVPSPDQIVQIINSTNTVIHLVGTAEEHVIPATLTIRKVDAQDGGPLAGAVFDVKFSTANDGRFNEDLGDCTTNGSGECSPAGNDGASLLPGDYQVTEISAPPGYVLDPATSAQTVTLTPGEAGAVTFADFLLGSLQVHKTGDDTAYDPITGATFSVAGPEPSQAEVGTLTVGADGTSSVLSGLEPGTYLVTETQPPPGYDTVAPVTVAVPQGHTTTTVDVLDHVQPASVTVMKVDREDGSPLAGAVFDVRYSTTGNGAYDADLGTCTTSISGACEPAGNDGAALLPGDYQVTEVSPPPGYVLDTASAVQTFTLTPGEAGTVTFSDPKLVGASFHKTASGNVNPQQISYAGAVITLTQGTPTGQAATSCTTDEAGNCSTDADLIAGSTYCWTETIAPAGLAAGASGCFVANNSQIDEPITVDDPGEFVAVTAKKVDAIDPFLALPGAVLDLYRVDGGRGPGATPAPPADAASERGETWVARSTSGPDGVTSFPLEYPGYSYCVVEHEAPENYVVSGGQSCTPILTGTTAAPAVPVAVTLSDTRATVALEAHKFNSRQPDTGVPGATYDLYVEGSDPPGLTPPVPPPHATVVPGDTWYERGTTDASGDLSFNVPAGFAWCLKEVTSPVDYVLDPALHCTTVLTTQSAPAQTMVALPETLATVHISAHKYNSLTPSTVIPGATYELVAQAQSVPGYALALPPAGVAVPTSDTFWGLAVSDHAGILSWSVPAGYSWCVHEVAAPAGYQPDPSFHCTATITTDTAADASSIALPELPVIPTLAFTGGPFGRLLGGGLLLMLGGLSTSAVARHRTRRPRKATTDTLDEPPET